MAIAVGSSSTMPRPATQTSVFTVPRSIATLLRKRIVLPSVAAMMCCTIRECYGRRGWWKEPSMRVPRLIVAAVGACGLAAAAMAAAGPAPGLSGLATVTVQPGVIRIGHAQSGPPTTADCEKAYKVACYEPGQIQQAYHLPAVYASGVTGKGATIVIVDSYGSPTIKNDLSVFDHTFGLPAPPSFRIIQPAGKVPAYDPNNSDMVGWAGETTLDVEWSHTIAPGASILLVETPVSETEGTAGFPQIVKAENYVIDHHLGQVISQSFGATEPTFPSAKSIYALRSAYINANAHGVTVLA